MWESSEDSDTQASSRPPAPAKSGPSAPKRTSKNKSSKVKTAPASQSAWNKTQSKFCGGDSDSSADSDSSSGKGADAQCGSATAWGPAAAKVSVPKPEAKAKAKAMSQPEAKAKSKPEAKATALASLQKKEAVPTKRQPVSGKQNRTSPASNPVLPSSQQPSRMKATSSLEAGSYSMDFPALGASSPASIKVTSCDPSMDFPPLGASLPTKEKVASEQAPARGPSDVPRSSNSQGNPNRGKSFQKHLSDSERGQQFSRREEKLSFNDFLPQRMQNKKEGKKGGKKSSWGQRSRAESLPGVGVFHPAEEDHLLAAGAMKGPDKTKAEPVASSQHSSKPPCSSQAAKTAGKGAIPKSRPSHERRNESSATDSSDDEDLSMFLTSNPSSLPPQSRHGASPVFPPAASRAGVEEETIPKQVVGGNWPRGQRPGNQRRREDSRGGRDRNHREHDDRPGHGRSGMDRNWRERGPEQGDAHRRPGRDNQDHRNNNRAANRRQQPHRENVRQDDRRGADGQNGRDGEDAHRPPPRAGADQEHGERAAPRQPPQAEGPAEPRQPPRPHPAGFRPQEANLSFGRLQELKTKAPAEVVAALSYSKEGLSRLLKNEDKLSTDAPLLKLLLAALVKACACTSMPVQRGGILNQVRSSSFLRILGTHLATSSMTAVVHDVMAIVGESAELLRTMLVLFPSCFHDVIMAHAFVDMALKQIQARGGGELPDDVAQKVKDLNVARDAAVEELQEKESHKKGVVDEDSQMPPNDFRHISVFPTLEDLDKEELPFLRKNKRVGGYTGLDHYLDVQFRLLREDFVYPLREGIMEYLQMIAEPHQRRRLRDIRVYYDVHILQAVCLQSGLGHRLVFDVSHMKNIRWEVSKRLIYGSLVCLSADNFQTLYFATVVNREPADLKEGIVDVTFEHDAQEVLAITPETTFTMAETTAFFEAYRHVLFGLQQFHADQLPFEKYIVRCEKTVSEPRYMSDKEASSSSVKYDLRPLVDDKILLREDVNLEQQGREVAYSFSQESQPANDIPILAREEWPDPKLLGLDSSQFEALYHSLTREFSLIQGPPGTGKTYVGLKIVKALLHNRKNWDPLYNSCMLIVCFTNHALDQFLEEVVSFFKGTVVRVGSRIRSEKLKQYSLNNLRWSMRRNREGVDRDFKEITRLRFQGNEAMNNLTGQIDTMGMKIELARREILHEDVLMPYMLDFHYDQLSEARRYMQDYYERQGNYKIFSIPEWLGIGPMLQASSQLSQQQLQEMDQGLQAGAGGEWEEGVDIEGEVQAQEEQNRLETDYTLPGKKRERGQVQAHERTRHLAVDISKLDQRMEAQGKGQGQGQGHGGGGGGGFQIPRKQWRKIKQRLRKNVAMNDIMTEEEERQVRDLWRLDLHQRWRLYRRWTHNLCRGLKEEMREKEILYDQLARSQQETLMQEDKYILKTATIIAMTTTAAARYQSVLQEVKPKVIVVEEAAEVLEGHVITTLSQGCEHLILIGDHKQLRPNPTVYKLAQKYNLELSLFERMINNGLKCNTLGWQHRMRPEIAKLVKPIYPALSNHPTVEDYPAVKGVTSNLFFINHSEPETTTEETKSHSNLFEAQYLVKFCSYLLKQGYLPSQITVLATYSGQLFQLRKLMPKADFDGVRVTVVDNFQGEENDIILLSLVRSNEEGHIGFLKIENRVCVALSRAKKGLYVIGNFDLLSAESTLWQRITKDLGSQGMLGEALPLYCQNHPSDQGLVIRTPADFDNAPEGGCMKPCTARLGCGHVCMSMCHPYDKEHKRYRCTKKCERKMDCEFKHSCKKQCYEYCGSCVVKVERKMDKCGHLQWIPCSTRVQDFICQDPCLKRLMCGHTCGDVCGEPHRCYETVTHTWPCGHVAEVACVQRDSTPCKYPCQQLLSCGHQCRGTCNECHGGRLHKQCSMKCSKILVCGHACRDSCSNCPPCCHKCESQCVHSSCPKLCGQPCQPCVEPCAWQCPHHSCQKLCHEPCDRPRCDEPCPFLLPCNHPCIGLCGEPCPRLCRVCNAEEVTNIFFGTEEEPDARFVQLEDCHHVLEVSGLDQWMTTATDEKEDSVQLKTCPYCKTPIRRNLRYGAFIKTQLSDIETIKGKMQGDVEKKGDMKAEIDLMIEDENEPTYINKKRMILKAGDRSCLESLVAMKNQMAFLEETKKLKLKRKRFWVHSATLDDGIEQFETWLCLRRMVFSDQELADAQAEVTRLQQWLALLVYKDRADKQEKQLPARLKDPLNNLILRMKDGLVHTKEHQRMTFDLLKELEEMIPNTGLGISEKERVMIVKAMGLDRGHWFKCPKGHVYAIADCGGATEESRCPECNATIGGTQHRLREDNSLAPEMDGATQPAWPTAINNLDDYDIIDDNLGDVLDDHSLDDNVEDFSDDDDDDYYRV